MTALTQERFDDLADGARVVIGDDEDNPYTKDGEFFTTSGGARVRARHFVGAIEARSVKLYDTTSPRRWRARYGPTHWTIPLTEREDGTWSALLFPTNQPDKMYRPGVYRSISPGSFGNVLAEPDQIPWEQMFKALATWVEEVDTTAQEELDKTKAALEASVEANRLLQLQFDQANRLRDALKAFMEAEPATGFLLSDGRTVQMGEELPRRDLAYRELPFGSVVKHGGGTYWWKRDEVTWVERRAGTESTGMGVNRLVYIGNGTSADPGAVTSAF